jgi:hypothetical protein
MPNRMTLREGYQTSGVQNLGRMVDALHYALLNSSPPGPGKDPVIILFPAWPDEWDADFKLLARGNFLVTSSFKNGKIASLEILSKSGSVCQLKNPWKNTKVVLYRNGKRSERISGDLLVFKTRPDETIKIVNGN